MVTVLSYVSYHSKTQKNYIIIYKYLAYFIHQWINIKAVNTYNSIKSLWNILTFRDFPKDLARQDSGGSPIILQHSHYGFLTFMTEDFKEYFNVLQSSQLTPCPYLSSPYSPFRQLIWQRLCHQPPFDHTAQFVS